VDDKILKDLDDAIDAAFEQSDNPIIGEDFWRDFTITAAAASILGILDDDIFVEVDEIELIKLAAIVAAEVMEED